MRSKSWARITYTLLILLTLMAKSSVSLHFHLKIYVDWFFTEKWKRPWWIGTNSSADCDHENSWMIHKWLLSRCHVPALCSLSWGMRMIYLIVCWPCQCGTVEHRWLHQRFYIISGLKTQTMLVGVPFSSISSLYQEVWLQQRNLVKTIKRILITLETLR